MRGNEHHITAAVDRESQILRQPAGFTMMEMVVVAVVLGLLIAIGLPSYRKVLERGYFRESQRILLAVYTGEEAYFLDKGSYLNSPATLADWRKLHMDDPNKISQIPVTFSVTTSGCGGGPCFKATATRNGGSCNNKTLTINEDRTFMPDLSTKVCWTACGCD